MVGDLLRAAWIGLAGGALVVYASHASSPRAWTAPFALTSALVLISPFGPGLLTYSSDLWMYLAFAERAAVGDWLLDREPYWMEPPADPHQGVEWLLIGKVHAWTGLSTLALTEVAGALTYIALSVVAWRLARTAFDGTPASWIALICFWLAAPLMWASLPLSRMVTFVFVLDATRRALVFQGSPREMVALGMSVALAFHAQSFGGMQALAAVALATLARARHSAAHVRAVTVSVGLALLVAWPVVGYAASRVGDEIAAAYLHGPGDVRVMGLLMPSPMELLRHSSPITILLAAGALAPQVRARMTPQARSLCALGSIVVLLLLFTPMYQLGARVIGGWMMRRVVVLAFLWIPAAATLTALLESRRRWWAPAGAIAAVLLFWLGGARVIRDYRHPEVYRPVSAAVRAEASTLRGMLKDQMYLSSPHLAYVVAAYTLGRPLAIPPGHGSPFHPFEARKRDAVNALARNTAECWAELFARYPGLQYLVTPAAADSIEAAMWRTDLGDRSPDEVRRELDRLGVLTPVSRGASLRVDRIAPPATGLTGRCQAPVTLE